VGWGYSLALDGDLLVTGYQRDGQLNTTRGVYVFQRNGTWANSTTPVARLTGTGRNFGYDVDVQGDLVAVSSPTYADGFVYGSIASSNPRSPVSIFQRQATWRSGADNLVATLAPATAQLTAESDAFGDQIAFFSTGLIAGSYTNNKSSSNRAPVFVFSGPFGLSGRASFSANPSGTLAISAAALATSLSLGTNITLQANKTATLPSSPTPPGPTPPSATRASASSSSAAMPPTPPSPSPLAPATWSSPPPIASRTAPAPPTPSVSTPSIPAAGSSIPPRPTRPARPTQPTFRPTSPPPGATGCTMAALLSPPRPSPPTCPPGMVLSTPSSPPSVSPSATRP
ncbi:MAG: hypothetical protein MUE42_03885, partial [Opitutaceae bacterium]|nr:hypothetical protein [Opitutaceae bacterium]